MANASCAAATSFSRTLAFYTYGKEGSSAGGVRAREEHKLERLGLTYYDRDEIVGRRSDVALPRGYEFAQFVHWRGLVAFDGEEHSFDGRQSRSVRAYDLVTRVPSSEDNRAAETKKR